jgi:hypothetical protein
VSASALIKDKLMRERSIVTVVALLAALLSLQAQAACKEKLQEMDQRMASSQMDVNQRNAVKMFRDQAAEMCSQGNDAAAVQMLGMMEMMLPPPQAQVEAAKLADARTKSQLTSHFLEGVWCSMTGEERSQMVFAADGTYKGCIHDSQLGAYGRCFEPESTATWLDDIHRVESVEQDQFIIVSVNRGPERVYLRGECKSHGR